MKKRNYLVRNFMFLLCGVLLFACSSDDGSGDNSDNPIANFTTPIKTVFTGATIKFTNNSLKATSYSWVFNGGEPNASTEEEPSVTYNTPGTYSVSLTAVNSQGNNTFTEPNYITVQVPPEETNATYSVTFIGNWSSSNHPVDFPAGDHFSPAVGMVHASGISLFEEGELASEGIEEMAEEGTNVGLNGEVDALVTAGTAMSYIDGPGLTSGFSEVTFEITVTNDFPLVSLVSMFGPSPDWYVAIENLNLYENGAFVDDLIINAVAYDAGTDSGSAYTSPDADTSPAENITLITGAPLGDGTSVDPPAAMFSFVKVD